MPERESVPVSVTSTPPAYQPVGRGSGTETEVLGAVRSILMPSTVLAVLLPALSVTWADAEMLLPSPSTMLASGTAPASPESASDASHVTVTSSLAQPVVLGVPVSVGLVLSMLMPVTPSLALLPAASVTVPLCD